MSKNLDLSLLEEFLNGFNRNIPSLVFIVYMFIRKVEITDKINIELLWKLHL